MFEEPQVATKILEVIKVPQEQVVDAPVPHVELAESLGEAGSSESRTRRTKLVHQSIQQSQSLMEKLVMFGLL